MYNSFTIYDEKMSLPVRNFKSINDDLKLSVKGIEQFYELKRGGRIGHLEVQLCRGLERAKNLHFHKKPSKSYNLEGFDTTWYRLLWGWPGANPTLLYLKISKIEVVFQAAYLFVRENPLVILRHGFYS